MKKLTTMALVALASASMLASSPTYAAKEKKSKTQQTLTTKNKGIEYQPVVIAGSKNWIKRLYVGRGPGFNGGFSGHPGGGGGR